MLYKNISYGLWLHEYGALATSPDGFIYKLLTYLH